MTRHWACATDLNLTTGILHKQNHHCDDVVMEIACRLQIIGFGREKLKVSVNLDNVYCIGIFV
jgi:hypothetical protein